MLLECKELYSSEWPVQHARPITLHETLHVVALMWKYRLMYGWAMETSVLVV